MSMPVVRKILVAVEVSKSDARAAVELAMTLARATSAAVTLLHAFAPPSPMSGIVPGAGRGSDLESEQRSFNASLEVIAGSMRAQGIARVSTIAEPGHPTEVILECARREASDLIVLGTHGRKGVSRLLMGSIAESVLRDAPCPVVIVHVPSPSHRPAVPNLRAV